MSLAINVTTPEGIVLAADSRQSYRNRKGMARIGSDNASKLFQLNKRIGILVTGLAFLQENEVLKNLGQFIEEYKRENNVEKLNVKKGTEELKYLFNKKYDWQKQLDKSAERIRLDLQRKGCKILESGKERHVVKFRFKDPQGNIKDSVVGIDKINLLVAGYNKNGSHGVYRCDIPGEFKNIRDSKVKGKEYGAAWIGQTDVIQRIVLGYDGRIKNIKFVLRSIQKETEETINKQLRNLEYVIQWGTMTLQDAIDFSSLMIQTTSAIQRFSDGIAAEPGSIPGVGGNTDIGVITPTKGFIWVSKKKLTFEKNEIDLDKEPNLFKETEKKSDKKPN